MTAKLGLTPCSTLRLIPGPNDRPPPGGTTYPAITSPLLGLTRRSRLLSPEHVPPARRCHLSCPDSATRHWAIAALAGLTSFRPNARAEPGVSPVVENTVRNSRNQIRQGLPRLVTLLSAVLSMPLAECIAVGTAIADGPPHRSQRALLKCFL